MTTPDPATLLILGASGDLAARLLIPGLGTLLALEPERRVQLVGAGTEDLSAEEWRTKVQGALDGVDATGPGIDDLLAGTVYRRADVTDAEDLRALLDLCEHAPSLYFALPPAVTNAACAQLATLDLPDGLRLALEKPFGTDAASARELNVQLAAIVPKDRIHRVDHFLGTSSVLNLLGLRFANRILEPVLRAEHVEKVEIVYDETLALEHRARYYDHAGALVDMLQSHLLQVLAVFTMEAPHSLGADDIRDQTGLVLRATHVWAGDPVASSRRARYAEGDIDGRRLPAYRDEDGVDPDAGTETLAEMVVGVDTWRWAGVPFLLRSGKALSSKRREIVVTFKPAQHVPEGFTGDIAPDRLRIAFGDDRVDLELNMNGQGDPYGIDREVLTTRFDSGHLKAYGEVLDGILRGDETLSVRGDTAERSWEIVAPVLDAWRADEVALEEYPAGSSGPDWSLLDAALGR